MSIDFGQRDLEGVIVEHNNDSPTYIIHDCKKGIIVSSRKQVQSNAPSSIADNTDEGSMSFDYIDNVYKG